MDINFLVKITARAWSLNILSVLHSGVAGRQAPLLAASGAGRTAFGQSLSSLIDLGLLERNPGHGHPLRPEFRLTPLGVKYGAIAHKISSVVPDDATFALLRRTWTLPVLVVSQEPKFFSEIKGNLGPITDRALSQSLHQLQAHHWLDRKIDTAMHPPRPLYQVANTGIRIAKAVNVKAS